MSSLTTTVIAPALPLAPDCHKLTHPVGVCLNTSVEATLPCAWHCMHSPDVTVKAYADVEHEMVAYANVDYQRFNFILNGCCLPALCIFGALGNLLTVYIFSRRTMQSTLNTFLAALALSDFLICVTALFMFSLPLASWTHYLVYPVIAYGTVVVYPIGLTAQTASIYFTVAASFDLLRIVWIRPRIWDGRRAGLCSSVGSCSMRTSRRCVYAVLIGSVVYNLPKWFEARVGDCYNLYWHQPSVTVCGSDFRLYSEVYQVVYYQLMYGIFINGLPIICLLLVCLLLAVKMMVIDRAPKHAKASAELRRLKLLMGGGAVASGGGCTDTLLPGSAVDSATANTPLVATAATLAAVSVIHSGKTTPTTTNADRLGRARATKNGGGRAQVAVFRQVSAALNGVTPTVEDGDDSSSDEEIGVDDGDGLGALIAVILLFIFCNTLGLLVNMLDEEKMGETMYYLIDMSNMLTVVNASVNCLIYTALSIAYRTHVLRRLGRLKGGCVAGNGRPPAPKTSVVVVSNGTLQRRLQQQQARRDTTPFARCSADDSNESATSETSSYVERETNEETL